MDDIVDPFKTQSLPSISVSPDEEIVDPFKQDEPKKAPGLPPEAADHGLSERQKLSPVGKALSPFTSYGDTYTRMRQEAQGQVGEGLHQIFHPKTGTDPYTKKEGIDVSDVLGGAAKTAIGAAGFAASPISAAYRSVVGQPLEDTTGIPREYTEFAAQLATPGLGLPALGKTPKPIVPPARPAAPTGPFGVTLTEGEQTGDLAARQAEQAALRGQAGKPAQEHAEEFLKDVRPQQLDQAHKDVTRALDPTGNQVLAQTPEDAAKLVQDTVTTEAARSKNNVTAAYDRAKALGGDLHPDVLKDMQTGLREELNNLPKPVVVDDDTPVAARMLKYLDDRISKLNIRNDADLSKPIPSAIAGVNLEGVEQLRKGLSGMRGDAIKAAGTNPSDNRAANAIMHAFDDHIHNAVNDPSKFNGTQQAVDAWNDARAAASERFKTYGNDAVGKKIQSIIGDARFEKDPASVQAVADFMYGSSGVTPSDLQLGVAKRLQKILGEDSPEWAAIRQGYFQRLTSTAEGVPDFGSGTLATRLSKALDERLAPIMFTPPQRDLLRQYADLHRQLSVPQVAANWPNTAAGIIPHVRAVSDKILGAVGAFIGHHVGSYPGAAVGWAAGTKASSLLNAAENSRNLKQVADQMPLLSQRMKQWQKAVIAAQRSSNAITKAQKAAATTNLIGSLSKFGVDNSAALKLLHAGPSGPGDSEAKQRARGGKVQPILESKETLEAQQKQLLSGDRHAQLFPNGKGELKLPKGMYRAKMENGDVFHYNPKHLNVKKIKEVSKKSRENEILGLGPVSKNEALSRVARGEHPVAVVERDATGNEVRAAAGTHATAALQARSLAKNKSAGHSIAIESPAHTLSLRRADGGAIRGYADGGDPTDDSSDMPDAAPRHVYMNMSGNEGVTKTDPQPDFNDRFIAPKAPEGVDVPAIQSELSGKQYFGDSQRKVLPKDYVENLPDVGKPLVDLEQQPTEGTQIANHLLGLNGHERYQTWPERMIRSGGSLAHDVMTGQVDPTLRRREDYTDMPYERKEEDRTWLGRALGLQATEPGPPDEYLQRVQDMAGMAGGAGLATGVEGADSATLGSGPFLRPGKIANKNDFLYAEDLPSSKLLSDSGEVGAPLSAAEHAAQPFYSAVEKTIQAAPQQKMHGEQWANWLKNQPGVKPDELQYTGVDKWLREQKGPVTKEQVADFVDKNKVQVNDVVRGGPNIQDRIDNYMNEGYDYEGASERAYADHDNALGTKYHSYQLPGGDNYREHLLTLPPTKNTIPQFKVINEHGHVESTWTDKAKAENWANKNGYAVREDKPVTLDAGYKSSHWDEPNILAHARTNERDVGGKPSLHIEELQSDWHQAGRKNGYKEDIPKDIQEIANKIGGGKDTSPFSIGIKDMKNASDNKLASENELSKLSDWLGPNWRNEAGYNVGRVPDAPFKTSWPELAMKRMIQRAATEGKERVSWTPGEAQAARYDLSKQLDEVRATKDSSGTYVVKGYKNDREVMHKSDFKENDLSDVVGKDLAEKIVKDAKVTDPHATTFKDWASYKGVDLKVGGEGMKGFYDQMLPKMVEKLGKQYGVKVKQADLAPDMLKTVESWLTDHYDLVGKGNGWQVVDKGTNKEIGPIHKTGDAATKWLYDNDYYKGSKPKAWYFDIPPKMKEDVLKKGFPLFSDTAHGGLLNQNARKDKQDVERPEQKAKTEPEINAPARAAGGRVLASNIDSSPSEAQKQAGSYKKDHLHIHGLDITIENAKGSTRSGVDENGKPWKVEMPCAYGYIRSINKQRK
jgi:Inorganic Pyrophosphatase